MNRSFLPWIMFTALVLVWGSSFILMKHALIAFSAVHIGAARIVFAALLTLTFAWPQLKEFRKEDIPAFLIVALLGNSIPYLLFPIAVAHIPSGVVGITNSMTPLFTLLVGLIVFGRKLRWVRALGVAVGFIGALILINPLDDHSSVGQSWPYLLLAVLAAACYGVSINTIGDRLKHLSPRAITLFAMLGALVPSLGILAATDFSAQFTGTSEMWSGLAAIAFLGMVGTSLAMVVFNRLIATTTPLFAASTTYVIPIVALAWGLVFGEELLYNHYIGMVIILIGVWMVNRKA
ncbi:MAG: DMT family transporter [Schleiferiaceae bacterium]|nr:DMT family transporter [Schleiferiaceae bacterium]